ncbi:NAD(P)-binding protein [Iamia sp. SCSIO 61187]|uniref:hydroxysqualene dehydroxylase n=1 Tax=Iamia sp. SCSIO 61187 TaxID=2722752 RepID=UPI001C627C04|nr:FAD-dependent oxidoreductase [Iamia sp. SCSIO 61187]QYG91153.1 NAD(P)-binding protein [Iamia sp. SCSIO 61187]
MTTRSDTPRDATQHNATVSRRRVLTGLAASAAGALTVGVAGPAGASAGDPPPRRQTATTGGGRAQPRVVVVGAGPGGLTAAHELAERGFAVTVVERKALGGKARSMGVAGTAAGGRRPLPGEHGFRFFPGFYRNLPDTMRRIPVPGNPNGVWDNLVDASGVAISRSGGREDLVIEAGPGALTAESMVRSVVAAFQLVTDVPPHELAWFANRLLVYLTSCEDRRYGQWENVGWWDFISAESMSTQYQEVVASGLTRSLVAAKPEVASTRTIGKMGEAFVLSAMGRGSDGAPDRVLDAPTNEAWIDPWIDHLETLGVRFESGLVEHLAVEGGRITAARVAGADGRTRTLTADWFVVAVPAERTPALWNADILALDPHLADTGRLVTDWMNGLQIYLREPVPLVHGHVAYLDSRWALTSISQAQFWAERSFPDDYGDGTVRDCLSIDISDWTRDGIVFGRPARECTPEEVFTEVWAQLKASLEDTGGEHLRDEVVASWHLDPAITYPRPGVVEAANDEPLLINTAGSWALRSEAHTGVPNLFLAADHVRTDIDLATMESANEAGRKAVNALLQEAGSSEPLTQVWSLYQPPELAAAKSLDRQRYRAGQPNVFDLPYPLAIATAP